MNLRSVGLGLGVGVLACGASDRERDVAAEAVGTGWLRIELSGALTLDTTWQGLGPDAVARLERPTVPFPWPTPGRALLGREDGRGWVVSGCGDAVGYATTARATPGWLCVDLSDGRFGASVGMHEAYPGDTGWTVHADHTAGPVGPDGAVTVVAPLVRNGVDEVGPVTVRLSWHFEGEARRWTWHHVPRRAP